jgi:hypothetical protein
VRFSGPALVATAAIAGAAAPLRAEPLPIALAVSRTQEAQACPDGAELQALVERVARRPLAGAGTAGGPGIAAEVVFERTEERFRARVHLAGAKTGERELTDTGPTCAPLAQAVAITLVLLADHGPEAQVTPPPAPPVELPTPAWRAGRLSASGGVGLGLVGRASAEVSVGMSAERRSGWGFDGDAFFVVPRRTPLPPGEVRVWLLAATLELCRAAGDSRRTLVRVCAGGAAGWLAGRGFGYPASGSNGLPWYAASARVALGGPIAGRLRWVAQGDLLVPLRRQSFSVDNLGTAWESRVIGGRLGLGLELSLW